MPMDCPNCGRVCPDGAERCDCGCDLAAWLLGEPYESPTGERTPRVTLPEVLVAVAVVGALLAIIVPNVFLRPPPGAQNACINNLRQIDSGKEQAALAYHWADYAPCVTTIVNQYIKGNTTPVCPCRGKYTYGCMGVNPTCSFQGSTTHKLPVCQ
jgi:hypothetical protein